MKFLLALMFAAASVAAPARAADPPADAVLAELPFLPTPEGGSENSVRIDLAPPGSRPLPLLVDTGSPESFATPRAAQDLGISLRRSKLSPYRRSTRLNRDIELNVDTRRTDTGASAGGEWAVLGARFLSHYVLEIDFPGRRVRFLDPDHFAVPERVSAANEAVLPIRIDNGNRPIVDVEVGAARVPAAITTGAPGTLLLPGGFAADASLTPDPEATAKLAPMPGAGRLQAVVAALFKLGPFAESEVPMLVAEHGAQGAGARSDALLGVEMLERFVMRIDYVRKRLWLAETAP